MEKLRRHKHEEKDRSGRYRTSPLCDCCNKPVGTAYFTDEEVCEGTDGPGFYICERKRCEKMREGLSVEERRALYESARAARKKMRP